MFPSPDSWPCVRPTRAGRGADRVAQTIRHQQNVLKFAPRARDTNPNRTLRWHSVAKVGSKQEGILQALVAGTSLLAKQGRVPRSRRVGRAAVMAHNGWGGACLEPLVVRPGAVVCMEQA